MADWSRRILVVDDDPLVSALVDSYLTGEGFEVRRCASAPEARDVVEEFDPDLAILDINLGGGPSGAHLGHVLHRLYPGLALLYFTRYPSSLITLAGSSDWTEGVMVLPKDDVRDPAVLLRAVEEALRGRRRRAVAEPDVDPGLRALTRTQLEVLRMVALGLTNSAIAERRRTSERAVEKHLKGIYEILGLSASREENPRVLAANRYIREMGRVEDDLRDAIGT